MSWVQWGLGGYAFNKIGPSGTLGKIGRMVQLSVTESAYLVSPAQRGMDVQPVNDAGRAEIRLRGMIAEECAKLRTGSFNKHSCC